MIEHDGGHSDDLCFIFLLSFSFSIFTLLKKKCEQYTDNFWETQAAFTQNNLCLGYYFFFKNPKVMKSHRRSEKRNIFPLFTEISNKPTKTNL